MPGDSPDVRVELTASGVAYTGAGRIEEDAEETSGRTTIVANGP